MLTAAGWRRTDVGIAGGRIAALGRDLAAHSEQDVRGARLLPGFIDVHVHGAGGFDVGAGTEAIRALAAVLPQMGVTSFLPTLAASSSEQTREFLDTVRQAATAPAVGQAEVLGAHLEGPFVNPAYCGALPAEHIRPPSVREIEDWLAGDASCLRRVTLAPELHGAEPAIRRLVREGVQVSLGHSEASFEQAQDAARWGASSVTHMFNAMRPFHHRQPGLAGAGLAGPTVTCELIADGRHVHPAAAMALIKARGPERVAIVSDGLPAMGLPAGRYDWLGREVTSDGSCVRLMDGTLAGSATSLAGALTNLLSWGCSLHPAATMLSDSGARLAGVSPRKGTLAPGADADILVLDDDLQLVATYCRGRLAYHRLHHRTQHPSR